MASAQSPHNVAAWALRAKERPFVVSAAPYTSPPPGHVVIEVHSVAINPIDWIDQDSDIFHMKYPTVLGGDIAGKIVELGQGVHDLEIGSRVIACEASLAVRAFEHQANNLPSNGSIHSANNAAFGAFQKYTLVSSSAVCELPPSIPFNNGVVLPLGITTASAGLFQEDFLTLPLPTSSPTSTSTSSHPQRVLLIWGGSSCVGSCAIQLAVASGAEVLTTASRANFAYCRALGASAVFDYHDSNIEDQIVAAVTGKTFAGAFDAVGADETVRACARVAERSLGKATVVTVRGVPEEGIPVSVRVKAIAARNIFSPGNVLGASIWRGYMPGALARGELLTKPDPKVVGSGLRSVQHGLDIQKRGMSSAKVVIEKIIGDTPKSERKVQ